MRRTAGLAIACILATTVVGCGTSAGPAGTAGRIAASPAEASPVAATSGSSPAAASQGTSPAAASPAVITLTSPAVANGQLLAAYRCEPRVNGVEASIPLAWSGVPAGTASLAIEMRHYPVPTDRTNVSWYLALWAIPPTVTEIPHGGAGTGPWYLGANKDGVAVSYTSPCSQGRGTHEYTVTIYALAATPPDLPSRSTKDVTGAVLVAAIARVPVLGTGTLTFTDTTP